MKVTLAYPVDGLGEPDQTVNVELARARQLIGEGIARAASEDASPLDDLTVPELRQLAEGHGVEAKGPKATLVAALAKANISPIPGPPEVTPVPVTAPTVADVKAYADENGMTTPAARQHFADQAHTDQPTS